MVEGVYHYAENFHTQIESDSPLCIYFISYLLHYHSRHQIQQTYSVGFKLLHRGVSCFRSFCNCLFVCNGCLNLHIFHLLLFLLNLGLFSIGLPPASLPLSPEDVSGFTNLLMASVSDRTTDRNAYACLSRPSFAALTFNCAWWSCSSWLRTC